MQDLASDASQAAYDATREPTTFEKVKGAFSPPSTADKLKAGAADAYANTKVSLRLQVSQHGQGPFCDTH